MRLVAYLSNRYRFVNSEKLCTFAAQKYENRSSNKAYCVVGNARNRCYCLYRKGAAYSR